jgi:hypothetical protein
MPRKSMLGALLALVALTASAGAEDKKGSPPGPKKKGGGYVHVVLFTMKKDAPKEAVGAAIADCHKMLGKIASVRAVKVGRPAEGNTEKFVRKDYDFALLVLVDDAAGIKAYLDDPLHVAFVKKHLKHFDTTKLRVFDFADQKN